MHFIRLEDVILPPPFPMLIALLILFGMVSTGARLADMIFDKKADTKDRILGYVVVVAFIAVITNMMAFSGLLSVWTTRIVAILLVAVGIYTLPGKLINLKTRSFRYWDYLRNISVLEFISILMLGVIITSLFLASLGPPTDHDSLDYHLGVPLDWLRNNGSYPRPDWLHARLVGIGESINLFGLQCGTDILGQVVQFSGLGVVWIALSQFAAGPKSRLLLALLVFTVPINIWLVTTQKPMLFPAAGLLLGFTTILNNTGKFDLRRYVFGIICILFAVACKYSFLISGSIAISFVLWFAYRHAHLRTAVISVMIIGTFIVLPVYLRNFLFYGDPLSPFLERLNPNQDPIVIAFAQNLKGSGTTLQSLLLLPFKLGVTLNPGLISTVLGIGIFGVFLLRKTHDHSAKMMLMLAGGIIISLLFVGQLKPRYYLEVYWLLVGSIVMISWSPKVKWFRNLLLLQAGMMAAIAIYGAFILFPGALTEGKRKEVMQKTAAGYPLSRWIGAQLPIDAVILAQTRSNAFMPRKFVSWESGLRYSDKTSREIRRLIDQDNLTAILFNIPLYSEWEWIKDCSDTGPDKIQTFFNATRNPFNRGSPYQMQLFIVNKKKSNC